MSDLTTHLLLPWMAAAQAQKHVTFNEAVRMLDGLVQLAVLDAHRAAPPAAPADGDRHIVAPGATGAWAGWEGSIAYRVDGAWLRLIPRPGWLAWNAAAGRPVIFDGAAWTPAIDALGGVALGAETVLARGPSLAATTATVEEALVEDLSGAAVETALTIPAGAILLGVSVRVTTAIAGATAFHLGTAADPQRFGADIGTAAGTVHAGPVSPAPAAAATPIRLTAVGGDFAGGAVRLAVHALRLQPPAA